MRAEGQAAPDFTLPDQNGDEVSLSDLRGRKVIVYFYPAASTPGCTTQACDFRDNLASLEGAGYAVLGISPDKPDKQAKFRDEEHVTYPLLCDPDRTVLEAYGAWGERPGRGEGVIRSTFLIGSDGRVEKAWYSVKPDGHALEVLSALRA